MDCISLLFLVRVLDDGVSVSSFLFSVAVGRVSRGGLYLVWLRQKLKNSNSNATAYSNVRPLRDWGIPGVWKVVTELH